MVELEKSKFIKSVEQIQNYPILDIEFDHIPDFDHLYIESNFHRKNYGDLHVETGRRELPIEQYDETFLSFQKEFHKTIDIIAKKLISLDTINYPIHMDLNRWYEKKIIMNENRMTLLTLDSPGFFMSWHLDNRLIIVSGVINLIDNTESTLFQRNNTGWFNDNFVGNPDNLIHIGKKSKHTGTFWLNTIDMWHAVPKLTNERKILLTNVFF